MIKYSYSQAHWIMPPIIMGVLVILLVLLLVKHIKLCKEKNKPLIDFKNLHFFNPGWDKLRFFGTIILFIAYIYLMRVITFLPASILCIFLYNLLFEGVEKLAGVPAAIKSKAYMKDPNFSSVVYSLIISVVASVLIWFLFGYVFDITLP